MSDTRIGAEHPWRSAADATSSCILTASLSTLDSCPSPPSQPPAQDTCERITLLPAFSLYLLSFSSLSCFGHDDQHLAAAAQHQYALNIVLSLSLSILLILFPTFSCSSGATTTRIPSP
jgi:hypothetical protein